MTQLTKKRSNGNGSRSFFPSLRNDLFSNRFFMPRFFDLDEDLFNGGTAGPPANVTETDKEFKLDISVPGLKREDFKIDVENGVLTVSSEKEEEKNDGGKNYHRREFSYSSFSRTFTLPDNTEEANINAKYDNGMLQIIIPKKEVTVSKQKKEIKVS